MVNTTTMLPLLFVIASSALAGHPSAIPLQPALPYVGTSGSDTVYPFDVRAYGAKGDGKIDDTVAFRNAFAAAGTNGGTVYVPQGLFLVTETIFIVGRTDLPVNLRGEGWGSNVLWSHDADLFVWVNSTAHIMIDNLAITSILSSKSANSTAIKFQQGVVQSVLSSLLFYGQGSIPGMNISAMLTGTNLDLGPITDTVTMRDCVHWFLGGTGVIIGKGSEVRIFGGRLIGNANRHDNSIGIRVTGNNGGVHIIETDVIALATGILLDSSNGQGSNREIFITHATMDSDGIGLHIKDNSYVSIAGCWAASSDDHNILIDESSAGAILVVTGGTIFNGGVYGGVDCTTSCNGLTALSGTFQLSGVDIRNNLGRGIWVPNGSSDFIVSGCRINSNGQGVLLNGSDFVVTSNIFVSNAAPSDFGNQTGAIITNNLMKDE